MNAAKIHLSEEELSLVQNAGWLLTKNTIIDKVYVLFGEIAHEMRDRVNAADPFWLSEEVRMISPKISKGENYQGLPYVMLDFPRLFGREHTFAIRTFFWWGHFFSVTLHVKGQYKERYRQSLLHHLPMLAEREFYICIGEDEWRHEFDEDNYIPISELNYTAAQKILLANNFCKLSAKISLSQWNQSKELLIERFQTIFTSINFQAGEKDLSPDNPITGSGL